MYRLVKEGKKNILFNVQIFQPASLDWHKEKTNYKATLKINNTKYNAGKQSCHNPHQHHYK